MSIFDDIRKDREAGTPRDWIFVQSESPCGQEWFGCGVAEESRDEFMWLEFDPEIDVPRARRIARVPRLERIALAADELADAADGLLSYLQSIDDGDTATTRALAAFRAACEGK